MIDRLEEVLREIKKDKDNKIIEKNERVIKVKYKDTVQFNRIKNIIHNHNTKYKIQYYVFMDKRIIYVYYDVYDDIDNDRLMVIYKSYTDSVEIYNKVDRQSLDAFRIEVYKKSIKIENEKEINKYNNVLLEYIINNKKDIENIYDNLMNNIINKIECYYI